MRVNLEANGTLRVSPSTTAEHYALKKWWIDFTNKNEGAAIAVDVDFGDGEKSSPERNSDEKRLS